MVGRDSFLVLIGSQARGDADERSDVDLLLIGEVPEERVQDLKSQFVAPLNLIAFSHDEFDGLYATGSLFLQHCFAEGILRDGDKSGWRKLRDRFTVQTDFLKELNRCARTCQLLAQTEIFGGQYLMPLVAAYTQAKNASIFGLAHCGRHVFSKNQALACAGELFHCADIGQIAELRSVYDYSVRGLDVPLPFPMDSLTCGTSALMNVARYVSGVVDACG